MASAIVRGSRLLEKLVKSQGCRVLGACGTSAQQRRHLAIHEYQAMEILKKHGVAVPLFKIAESASAAETIAKEFGKSFLRKMMLHNKENVSSKALISSVDGTIRPALDIFAHAIRYLKEHLLDAIKLEIGHKPDPSSIRWVITVPAIWSDQSKQFMREATFRAGCIPNKDSGNLVIALEPEVASLCCRRLSIAQYETAGKIAFPKETKYMVLDCGGGTIDITVHEMLSDKKVKEVLRASGGPWGGTKVDDNFISLMEHALGKNFIKTFMKKHPQSWLYFLTNFERAKKSVKNEDTSKIALAPIYSMGSLFAEMNNGKAIDKHLQLGICDGVTFGQGMIVINNKTAKSLISPVIQTIVQHTRNLLLGAKTSGLKYIFMVGGFSECQLLQGEIKTQFERKGIKVLIPSEAQLAIIKGAVLYGHQPEEINSRISRFSYGFRNTAHFDPKIHDETRLHIINGFAYCKNVFECIVAAGDEIKTNQTVLVSRFPGFENQTQMTFPFFMKDGKPCRPVQFTDEENMKQIGTVNVDVPGHGLNRKVELSFTFGGTEIQVKAKDMAWGNTTTTTMDFLHG